MHMIRSIMLDLSHLFSQLKTKKHRFYSQMLLFSGERMRQGLHTLCPISINIWVKGSCDFVNEASYLLNQIIALFHIIHLQRGTIHSAKICMFSACYECCIWVCYTGIYPVNKSCEYILYIS